MLRKLLDNRKTALTNSDIARFQSEITKEPSGKAYSETTTSKLIDKGAAAMKEDSFRLLEGQLDI